MNNETLSETSEYRLYKIEIHTDSDPMNPRVDWDNLGTMVLFWNNYELGDKETHPDGYKMDKEEAEEFSKRKDIIAIPLYIYEHSGITIRAGAPFGDVWDSGCGGYTYITKKKACEEFGWKRMTAKRTKEMEDRLKSEVEVYDDYLTGAVYGFVIKDRADIIYKAKELGKKFLKESVEGGIQQELKI